MRSILKQSSYVLFAQVLNRIISFFYIIYLARILEVSDFGLYTVALAYFAIISGIADFGFNRFLMREVARDKSVISQLLFNIVMLRLTLTSVFFAVFSLILYFLDPDKVRVSLILLATIAILPQAVAFTFDAVFAALQKLQFSAIALFASSLTTALTGFVLVRGGFGPTGAITALIVGQIIYAVFLILLFFNKQKLVWSVINFNAIKQAVAGSLPYGLLGVLGLLYFRIDTVMLAYLKGSFETGIYGAAYKFLEAVIFIPSVLSMALFPVLARVHETSPQSLKKIYFKSLKIMLLISLLILFGYLFILPVIISSVLPKYLPSVTAIRILSLSIPFMFIHVPAVTVLLSTEKFLKQVLILSAGMVVFNIGANLAFIPKFGFIGASVVTVASEVLSFIIFFILVKKKVLDQAKG
ncbi:flippase [Candidatus Daviesbacteria bacterium]|nr:flippase [Candidatus Daviesbacteria bacterium]